MQIIPDLLSNRHALVDEGRLFDPDWYSFFKLALDAIRNRVAITGTVTFGGGTTAAVTLATPLANANYNVSVDSPENRTVWVTSKTATGFTINLSSASSATYGYTVVRL